MFKRILIMSVLGAILVACGGDGGSNRAQVSQGVFIDSAVQGLRYVTTTQSGTTSADGSFNYIAGEMVEFYIGDILIGTVTAKATVTPIDLVPGAVDQTNPTVTNILRFVQALDDDDDTSNGIQISTVVSNLAFNVTVNFSQSITAFENDGNVQSVVSSLTSARTAGPGLLVDSGIAQQHLLSSLADLGNTGSTGNSGDFGSLAMSGSADISVIGSGFSPTTAVPVNSSNQTVGVVWTGSQGIGTVNVQASTVTVSFSGNTPSSIVMAHGFSNSTSYGYLKTCFSQVDDCSGITVDLDNKSVNFSDVVISPLVSGTNQATDSVILNGVLTWE